MKINFPEIITITNPHIIIMGKWIYIVEFRFDDKTKRAEIVYKYTIASFNGHLSEFSKICKHLGTLGQECEKCKYFLQDDKYFDLINIFELNGSCLSVTKKIMQALETLTSLGIKPYDENPIIDLKTNKFREFANILFDLVTKAVRFITVSNPNVYYFLVEGSDIISHNGIDYAIDFQQYFDY